MPVPLACNSITPCKPLRCIWSSVFEDQSTSFASRYFLIRKLIILRAEAEETPALVTCGPVRQPLFPRLSSESVSPPRYTRNIFEKFIFHFNRVQLTLANHPLSDRRSRRSQSNDCADSWTVDDICIVGRLGSVLYQPRLRSACTRLPDFEGHAVEDIGTNPKAVEALKIHTIVDHH